MLQSWQVSFTALQDGQIRGFGAEQFHGVLFEMLKALDPPFAAELHERTAKPFSITGIRGSFAHRAGWTYLSGDQEYRFYIHTLDVPMRDHLELLAAWEPSAEREWAIGSVRITPPQIGAVSEPVSYAAVLERAFEAPALAKVCVNFRSPTSFRRNGTQLLLPETGLVVESLLRRWNRIGDVELDADERVLSEALRISQYNLSTSLVPFDKYPIIGFRGELQYSLAKDVDPYHQGILRALFRFAEYAGIGYKTTMGMGEVRTRCYAEERGTSRSEGVSRYAD
jgi:CRISPR-associated endoribonuclease Cas6